ncbi:Polyadenylate-binding protein-interacting protein 2 [Ananas comosus]|uniref:Polyadenylate-binding protein-interacting protein 2 n=1 Tax=Ananas comosus TaxID=4615 RepID=A0A199V8H2_ANACO|nr:Polyadenylate-binding protein-interacting protein 2 [Ananas comosus]
MSGLNPGAAPYLPGLFRAVKDYSPEWWELVGSSPWFRDYWLRDRFLDPENAPDPTDIYDPAIPDDLYAFFLDHDADDTEEKEDGKGGERRKEMVVCGAEKWRMSRQRAQAARYGEKAPKIVKIVRVSPRPIQQPK